MRILFVTMFPLETNTSATMQNKGVIEGLIRLGHVVDLLTCRPNPQSISYDDATDFNKTINEIYHLDLDNKYSMFMTKKISNTNDSILKPFLYKIIRSTVKCFVENFFIFDAQKSNIKNLKRLSIDFSIYDCIISSSDPKSSHLIVDKIKKSSKNYRFKWIQYWGDPMFHDVTRKKDWRDSLVKYGENRLLKKADRIVYASPTTLEQQKKTFTMHSSKMDYASQATLHYGTKSKERHNETNGEVVIGYYGAYFSSIRDIIPLYNSFLDSKYKLEICGNTDLKLIGTSNISIYNHKNYEEIKRFEENADILVCLCNKNGTQIPGKIYYCAGYNKPIIIILDGPNKSVLREYFDSFNRYITCDNNIESIRKAINMARSLTMDFTFKLDERLSTVFFAEKIVNKIYWEEKNER
jgi:hypothetical protein